MCLVSLAADPPSPHVGGRRGEGLANIAIHQFSMNNNQVMCALVSKVGARSVIGCYRVIARLSVCTSSTQC